MLVLQNKNTSRYGSPADLYGKLRRVRCCFSSQSSSLQSNKLMSGSALRGVLRPQEQTMGDFVVTTIYFDGRFWSALIEKNEIGRFYAGRYIFGAEPSNPRLLDWIINEFAAVPLLPIDQPVKIKVKKLSEKKYSGSLCKSLDVFKAAQKIFLSEQKHTRREKIRTDKLKLWEQKHEKRKEKRKH
jgi:hypothetical protein